MKKYFSCFSNRILVLVLLSGICGGSVYPLIKIANQYEIPKFAYIFWESLIIATLLSSIAYCRGARTLVRISESKYYLFCALTNIIIPQSIFFLIATHLPTSVIGLVTTMTPIFIYASLLMFSKETLIVRKAIGVTIGLLGAASLFLPQLSVVEFQLDWRWLLFSLLLPIDYATNRIFVTKLRPPGSSSDSLTIGLFLTVAIITGSLTLFTGQLYNPIYNLNLGLLALVSHAVLMTLFYIMFFVLAKEGAVQNSLSFYVAPLTAMAWGYLVFSEQIGLFFIFASIAVFYGLYLVTKK